MLELMSNDNFVRKIFTNVGMTKRIKTTIPMNPVEFFIKEIPDINTLIDSPSGLPIIGIKLPANLILLAATLSDATERFVLKRRIIEKIVIIDVSNIVMIFFTSFEILSTPFKLPTPFTKLRPKHICKTGDIRFCITKLIIVTVAERPAHSTIAVAVFPPIVYRMVIIGIIALIRRFIFLRKVVIMLEFDLMISKHISERVNVVINVIAFERLSLDIAFLEAFISEIIITAESK